MFSGHGFLSRWRAVSVIAILQISLLSAALGQQPPYDVFPPADPPYYRVRYEASKDFVGQTYGNEFARAWELYLAGSQAAFASGWMQLFQIVFAPNGSSPPFPTRAALYQTARTAP